MALHKDAKLELIKRLPLFAECTHDELVEVERSADEFDLATGRELTHQGEFGQEFVVVVDGQAEVRDGNTVVATLGPGDFFGELSLINRQPRTATVVASTPVHALIISAPAFRRLLDDLPSFRDKVTRAAAARTGEGEPA